MHGFTVMCRESRNAVVVKLGRELHQCMTEMVTVCKVARVCCIPSQCCRDISYRLDATSVDVACSQHHDQREVTETSVMI